MNASESQISALRTEACLAGDTAQVELCDLALGVVSDQPDDREDPDCLAAYHECCRVIADAAAQTAANHCGICHDRLPDGAVVCDRHEQEPAWIEGATGWERP